MMVPTNDVPIIMVFLRKTCFSEPTFQASESTIVRRLIISALLTIVFTVEAGKRRLSMTSLYEAFSCVRIALLNPQTVPVMMVSDGCPPCSRNLPDLTSMQCRSTLLFRGNERYVSCFEDSDGKGL